MEQPHTWTIGLSRLRALDELKFLISGCYKRKHELGRVSFGGAYKKKIRKKEIIITITMRQLNTRSAKVS